MLIRLTLARWRRCAGMWLRSLALIFLLILLTEQVASSMANRAETTRQLLATTPIRCVLATPEGRTENVGVMNGLVYSFVEGGWRKYVSELSIRTQTVVQLDDGVEALISGVTQPCYEELAFLGSDPGVTWADGWDASVFDTQESVCVIGEALLPYTVMAEDGSLMLTMTVVEHQEIRERTWRVVGACREERAFWCPFRALYDWTIAPNGERLSFILADNALLDEFLQEAAPYFTPNENGVYPVLSQLVVQDESYRNVEQASRRNELLLQIVGPLFTVLAFAAGVLASFLSVRTRRQEMAVLQGMGVTPLWLVAQSLLENAAPCLLVIPAAGALGWHLGMTVALIAVYVLGFLIPIGVYVARPLIQRIRD